MKLYRISYTTFLCWLYAICSAQNAETDSLLNSLKLSKADSSRVQTLVQLAIEMDKMGDYHEGLRYSSQAKALSEKISYSRGLGLSYNIGGVLERSKGMIKNALESHYKALAIFEASTDKDGLARSYQNIANCYLDLSDYPRALDFDNKALKLYEELGNTARVGIILGNMGLVYQDLGKLPLALEHYLRSLAIAEKSGDRMSVCRAYSNIGATYSDLGDHKKALEYGFKGLEIDRKYGNNEDIAGDLINIGMEYKKLHDFREAEKYYQDALQMIRKGKNRFLEMRLLYNMGSMYGEQDKESDALHNFMASLKLAKEDGDSKVIAFNLGSIGLAYIRGKKYKNAGEYIDRAIAFCDSSGLITHKSNFIQARIELDSATGNYKRALEDFKTFISIRDSINNAGNVKRQTQLEMQYEFDKKQSADSIKVAEEKKVAAAELRSEKNKRYTLYGGLGLVLVFAGFMYNRFRVTQNQKKIIEVQKRTVEEQKKIVEEKNKEVTDSIQYAKRIQQSLLPTEKYLVKILKKENFRERKN